MRVCLYGGPCVGKSVLAARLFADLKMQHKNIELITEWIKPLAYEKKTIHKFDQIYIFGQQLHAEYQYLVNGVENIICDSSPLNSVIYGNPSFHSYIESIYTAYEAEYPSMNIFVSRNGIPYSLNGRWQTLEEALKVDMHILNYLLNRYGNSLYILGNGTDYSNLLDEIAKRIQ